MTATHRLSASYSIMRPPSQPPTDIEVADVLTAVLGLFHERMPVVDARAYRVPLSAIVRVEVDVMLFGAGEEADVVDRVQNATGLPPVDDITLRARKRARR